MDMDVNTMFLKSFFFQTISCHLKTVNQESALFVTIDLILILKTFFLNLATNIQSLPTVLYGICECFGRSDTPAGMDNDDKLSALGVI